MEMRLGIGMGLRRGNGTGLEERREVSKTE